MNRTIFLVLAVLFLLGAAWILLPFTSHSVVLSPGLDKNRPAGQIIQGFRLTETVPASFLSALDPSSTADCIALRFATYMRRNDGLVEVTFGQEGLGHRWVLDVSKLDDNAYVNLCLDRPIQVGKPFWLGVNGIDGQRDQSATVWLSATHGRQVTVNGKPAPGWGLALRLSHSRQIRLPDLLQLNHGVFIAGFLLSVIIGLLTLWQSVSGSGVSPKIADGQRLPGSPAAE